MLEGISVTFTDIVRTHWAFPYVALATTGFPVLSEQVATT